MKPPIKYYGGKSNMMNKIKEHFPPKESYDTYIEPFGGSFSIGLTIEAPNLIYNDLEKNVYSLYKVLSDKKKFEVFKYRCDMTPYSEDLREIYKKYCLNDELTDIERAFYFFYVNRTSYNGDGKFSINVSIRRNMSKSVSDYLSAIDRLPQLHQILSKVIITNRDGIELIKKYNTDNIFMYLDPPYEQSTRTSARYSQDMDRTTHLKLLDAVQDSKAKILISGYDCDIYKQLEKSGWKKVQFEVNTVNSSRKPKKKIENLWFNYK